MYLPHKDVSILTSSDSLMRRIKWRTVVVSLLSCFAILMLPAMLDELTSRQLAQLRKESSEQKMLKMKSVEVVEGKTKLSVFNLDGIWSWMAQMIPKLMGPVKEEG